MKKNKQYNVQILKKRKQNNTKCVSEDMQWSCPVEMKTTMTCTLFRKLWVKWCY